MLKTPWDFSSSTRVIQVHTVTLRALPSVGARFVVVSVYECDLTGNRLAGEAALPLQDPRVRTRTEEELCEETSDMVHDVQVP